MEVVKILGEQKLVPSVTFMLELPTYSQHFLQQEPVTGKLPSKLEEVNFVNSENMAYEKKGRGCSLSSVSCNKGSDADQFLQSKLSTYPLPQNAGPVVPNYDRKESDYDCEKVIIENTSFIHNENQKCGKWTPAENDGISIFPSFIVEPFDDDSDIKEKGPCSNKNMSLIYTCNKLKCSILCSCKICTSLKKDCKLICRNYPCPRCTPQCPKHRIGLDRAFDIDKHEYSVKAIANRAIKFIVKHTDIPLDCEQCRNDLIDHLTFHKIFHTRCKFCKQLMAPYSFYHVIKLEDYWQAMDKVARRANLTCASCLKMFQEPRNRRRHEEALHEMKSPFGCNDCDKKFSNKEDLNYHHESQHAAALPVLCGICDKEFKSKASLRIHQDRIHSDENNFNCDECDSCFTQRNNLLRHKDEKHMGQSVDWRLLQFVEDLQFTCEICLNKFKRRSNLMQHKQMVHRMEINGKSISTNKCAKCEKDFSNKSNCKKHEKQCQAASTSPDS